MDSRVEAQKLFKISSTTYYWSTFFFPAEVRGDVTKLYAFVRTADNYVDQKVQDKVGLYRFREMYETKNTSNMIVANFLYLEEKYSFEQDWVSSFFDSMEMDLYKRTYNNMEELEKYIYGSASVVGLMMCAILGLDKDSYKFGERLGYSMQFINIIRDLKEDFEELDRMYIPKEVLEEFGVFSLEKEEVLRNKLEFINMIRSQIQIYDKWQEEAEKGYKYIPKKYLIAIKTAADKYKWTARKINSDPLAVYQRKVKPSKVHVLLSGFYNYFVL